MQLFIPYLSSGLAIQYKKHYIQLTQLAHSKSIKYKELVTNTLHLPSLKIESLNYCHLRDLNKNLRTQVIAVQFQRDRELERVIP